MTTQPAPPSQADVLHAIAALLEARPSAAVLGHYPTLRIQTNNLHDVLSAAIGIVDRIIDEWAVELARDDCVATEFRPAGSALSAYRTIAPALVHNVHRTADFLLEEARAMAAVDTNRAGDTTPSFSDFVRLGAAVRGFLDAAVQAAYQLATFDGLRLNYKFLQSLLSFAAVAPASLHSNIVSAEMQAALNAYVTLAGKDRKNSAFTKAAHDQFPQRLAVGAQVVGLPDWRRRNLELLFSFCSDFVHSGYASVLAIGGEVPGFILGGPGDAFTPRAENFAELKQRLLAECAGVYSELLAPLLRRAMDRMLVSGAPTAWVERLDTAIGRVGDARAILHRRLVEPIRQGLLGSSKVLELRCMCGCQVQLESPHHEWEQFCPDCGSRFSMHEVDEAVDYVVSAAGIGDVIGCDALKIAELDQAARDKLTRIAAIHAPVDEKDEVSFVLITDLERCDEVTLQVPYRVTSGPSDTDRAQCSLMAFVAAKSMERCPVVRVTCNCGTAADYRTATGNNTVQCARCRTNIGLLGISGDGDGVSILNPDGSPGTAPIQARSRFKVSGIATD